MRVTQRELAESIAGLRSYAKDLNEAADSEPVEGTKGKVVMTSVKGLRLTADFLERVAQELVTLIPEDPVEPPPA